MTKPAECSYCGRPIEQLSIGRPRRYCDQSCRQRAYDQRHLEAAALAGKQRALDQLRARTTGQLPEPVLTRPMEPLR